MIAKVAISIVLLGLLVDWSAVECNELADIMEALFRPAIREEDFLTGTQVIELCRRAKDLGIQEPPRNIHKINKLALINDLLTLCTFDYGGQGLCRNAETWSAYSNFRKSNYVRKGPNSRSCSYACEVQQKEFCSKNFEDKITQAIDSIEPRQDYIDMNTFKDYHNSIGNRQKIQAVATAAAEYLMMKRDYAPLPEKKKDWKTIYAATVLPVCNKICSHLDDYFMEYEAKKSFLSIPEADLWFQVRKGCLLLINDDNRIVARVRTAATKINHPNPQASSTSTSNLSE